MRARITGFNPMSGNWPTVTVDLAVVVAIACVGRAIAETQTPGKSAWTTFVAATALLVMVIVAVPLQVLLIAQRRESERATEPLKQQNEHQEFDARLGRALDVADTEPTALQVAAKALPMSGLDLQGSILLADDSDAHLQTVITTAGRSRPESIAHQAGQCVGMLRATAQTQLQATTDPLTGLYNRRSIENSVRTLVRVNVPFADSLHAYDVLDRVRLELTSVVSDGRTPAFTVSAGIADTTESGDYQALLALADERPMHAKRCGRDRIVASTTKLPVDMEHRAPTTSR